MRQSKGRWTVLALTWIAIVGIGALGSASDAAEKAGTDQDGSVDINRAGIAELTAIPGIGEVLAKRIVAFREEHGSFQRIEDLMKVKGIGRKSLERLRPHLRVSRAS